MAAGKKVAKNDSRKVKMTKKAEKGMQNYEMNLAKIRIFLKICTTVAEKMHKIVRTKKTYVQMHKNGQKGRRVSVLSS